MKMKRGQSVKTLDLHGVRHIHVQHKVEWFLYDCYCNKELFPVKIITGNSQKMRDLVIECVKNMDPTYEINTDKFSELIIY